MEKISFISIKTKRDAVYYFSQFLRDYALTLEGFKAFSFMKLQNDNEYGCPGRSFDCDDTNLARAIYFIVWNNLPEMDIFEIGTGKKYRGDTLNTFNTLFNREYNRADILSGGNIRFLKEVSDFEKQFLTVGNFSVLPNIKANGLTLNTYRGQWWSYKDFYPVFLENLILCFKGNAKNKYLNDLYIQNKFYFDFISSPEKFISVNFLEKYFCNGNIINIGEEKLNKWFENSDYENYISFSENFITYSTKVINDRAEKIVDYLDKALKES